jgi:AcrR family transcriptional regulator
VSGADGADQGSGRRVGRSGRRLDSSRDGAILRAALEGLAESGYDRLTMDDIAARAHAGKGALYRRWPSKAALVVDALVAWRAETGPTVLPDTGSLRGDIEAMVAAIPDFDDADRRQLSVLIGLATAASRDPELAAALSDYLDGPRGVLQEMLERAVARGEISPHRDLSLMPDIVVGLNILRTLIGEVPDRDFVRRVYEEVIYPLVTAPATTAPATTAPATTAPGGAAPACPSR